MRYFILHDHTLDTLLLFLLVRSGRRHAHPYKQLVQCSKLFLFLFYSDPFASNFEKSFGISSQGVFFVRGSFNYQKAEIVCEAFGARLATASEIGQVASNDGLGYCTR